MRRAPFRTLIRPAAVAACSAAPLLYWIVLGRTLVWRDTAKFNGSLQALVEGALRELRLPQWNPHAGAGLPLFADPVFATLHPITVLAAFVAPGASLDLHIVLGVVGAALGAWTLARTLGASDAAAAAGGLGYALGGYVLGMSSMLYLLLAAATAPWALAALVAAARGGSRRIAVGALAFGALFLAGDMQWALVTAGVGLALAAAREGIRGAARVVATLAIASAIAAVQLLPTWLHLQETPRIAGVGGLREMWAFVPSRMLEWIAPGLMGERVETWAPVFMLMDWNPAFGEVTVPFTPSVFLGLPILAAAAAAPWGSRTGRVLAVSALVLLWVAFGHRLGAEQLLHHVPVWRGFRFPEKLIGPFSLCVCVLAALGIDRLARRPPSRLALWAGAAAAACAAAAAWFLTGHGHGFLAAIADGALPAELARENLALASARLGFGLLHASVATGALALCLAALGRAQRASLVPAAFAAVVLAHAAAAAPFAIHAGRTDLPGGESLRRLPSTGLGPTRLASVTLFTKPLRTLNAEGIQGCDALCRAEPTASSIDVAQSLSRGTGADEFAAAEGLDTIEYTTPLVLDRTENALAYTRTHKHRARRFSTTHVAVRVPGRGDAKQREAAELALADGVPVHTDPLGRFVIAEVPHRPWAFFAVDTVPVTGAARAVALVQRFLQTQHDAVVVETPARPPAAPGRVTAVERRPESLRIEAEAAGDGLLVVNDAFASGWTATIDGAPVPILPADVMMRAVTWPAGRHVLEMRYRAPGLAAGLALSAAGLAAALVLLVWPRWARPRDGAAAAE